jgi:hypothetical protein
VEANQYQGIPFSALWLFWLDDWHRLSTQPQHHRAKHGIFVLEDRMPKYDFDKNIQEIEEMPPGEERAAQLAVYGLMTGGAHHKQWILEQILASLGVDLNNLRNWLEDDGYSWEKGIAP